MKLGETMQFCIVHVSPGRTSANRSVASPNQPPAAGNDILKATMTDRRMCMTLAARVNFPVKARNGTVDVETRQRATFVFRASETIITSPSLAPSIAL